MARFTIYKRNTLYSIDVIADDPEAGLRKVIHMFPDNTDLGKFLLTFEQVPENEAIYHIRKKYSKDEFFYNVFIG